MKRILQEVLTITLYLRIFKLLKINNFLFYFTKCQLSTLANVIIVH